jgi:hypothetical protein
MNWDRLLSPEVLVFVLPIVAIVCGCVIACARMYFTHAERVAMIRQGMRPDDLDEDSPHENLERQETKSNASA